MYRGSLRHVFFCSVALLTVLVLSPGCSGDRATEPQLDEFGSPFDGTDDAVFQDQQSGDLPPAGLAQLDFAGQQLACWPWTGDAFDGVAIDPINVAFVGQAGPLQIREALLSLDGDRSAFGVPPVPPFDAEWRDIVGGAVQTNWAEGGQGWTGSVVQLTLGEFGPLRFHLRLFSTDQGYGDDGVWTLGGAHFEIQIPNTTEHQVLSWELAEQIVLIDMMRCGLLDPDIPMLPSGPINDAPSWRSIPAMIYNGLPDELVLLLGGPPKPVQDDVPLPSDGSATIFQLAQALPITPGVWNGSAHVDFGQIVPRPFCAEGPGDWLMITGPVDFVTEVAVDETGRYSIRSDFSGRLLGVPVDPTTGQPLPLAEPVSARVEGKQQGFMDAFGERISSRDQRMAFGDGGPEMVLTQLRVPSSGKKGYQLLLRCFGSTD